MIDRLYSWLDIEDVLKRTAQDGSWPTWLRECAAYWDSVELLVEPGTPTSAVHDWLRSVFGRLFQDGPEPGFILEWVPPTGRHLPVAVEVSEREAPPRRPRLRSPAVSRDLGRPLPRPDGDLDAAAVVAFHSFKGGVGRTLHALLLAHALTRHGPVLLVDGDLEAPGLSWLLADRVTEPPISYTDLLALIQGATDDELDSVIRLSVDRLQNLRLGDIFVLPAFRTAGAPQEIRVSPADLVNRDRDPYVLSRILSTIATRLGATAALLDLRAGLSELSAGALLDPRVHRVFVTTLSHQAVAGTQSLVDLIAHEAPASGQSDPSPAVVVSQVLAGQEAAVANISGQIADRLADAAAPQDPVATGTDAFPIVTSAFRQEWLALPGDWDDVAKLLSTDSARAVVEPLMEWLTPLLRRPADRQELIDPDDQRRRLAETARSLTYAEQAVFLGGGDSFLTTAALARLASDHHTETPIVVTVGAKGSGKTFTFLQLTSSASWDQFARRAGVRGRTQESLVVPVLGPINVDQRVEAAFEAARRRAAPDPATTVPASMRLRDDVNRATQSTLTPADWRNVWLDVIAKSVGLNGTLADAEARVESLARQQRLIFIFDGLEDVFQGFAVNRAEQVAIRALVQEVPAWLRLLPGRPLGLLVFVREDIVRAAVQQNAAQLLAQYGPYRLEWNDTEALRLVVWVAEKAGALDALTTLPIEQADQEQLERVLLPVWGEKLGSERSREARSPEWFLAALSDFRGQIQARDIVLFLAEAASASVGDSRRDRLFTPLAMRQALPRCSAEKLEAIESENPSLARIFARLRGLEQELRQQPFQRDDVGLSSDEIELLEANGVVLREGNDYWLPEIYRHGLGFTNPSRPRIMKLARRARRS